MIQRLGDPSSAYTSDSLEKGIVGCSTPFSKSDKEEVAKLNIINIYADDLFYGDLSCYEATEIKTPTSINWQKKESNFLVGTVLQQLVHPVVMDFNNLK